MSPIPNPILHLRSTYPTLRPAEKRLADVILHNPEKVVHLSITELACRANVSDTTIVKFCKRLGYKGYQEFKILLAQDVVVKHVPVYGQIEVEDEVGTIKEKIFQANIKALQDTVQVLNTRALEAAVEVISGAREIHFYGMGASGIVALDAEQKFSRIGLRASAFVDWHMQITRASLLTPDDVAVGVSYSGDTRETVKSLETARQAGAFAIAVTNYSTSDIVKVADLVLLTASQEEIFRYGAISSRIAQLSAIDALFIAVSLVDFNQSRQFIEKTKKAISRRNIESEEYF